MRCRNGNFTKALSRTDRLRDGDTSAGDISFVTPDITVDDYEKQYHLKAYKHAGDDKITNSDAEPAAKDSKLEWVSVGYPTLLVTNEVGNPSNVKLFDFDDEGLYTYVQMLTESIVTVCH